MQNRKMLPARRMFQTVCFGSPLDVWSKHISSGGYAYRAEVEYVVSASCQKRSAIIWAYV
jgi:hypothetical protein